MTNASLLRWSVILVALVALGGVRLPARAAVGPYACPTDPGFCYLDVGGDGCFDPGGGDQGPIDDALRRGVWPPGPGFDPGSLVCPPSVVAMTIVAERGFVSWGAPEDHVLAFFGRRITVLGATIVHFGAGTVRLDAQVQAPRDAVVSVEAHDDATVDGGTRLKGTASRFTVGSQEGSIRVGPDTRWRAGHLSFIAFGNDMKGKQVVVGDGVRLMPRGESPLVADLRIEGVEGVHLENLRARARGSIRIRSFGGLVAEGNTDLHAVKGNILFHAGAGPLRADRVTARAVGRIQVSGTEVELGAPGAMPSRLQVRDRESGEIEIGGFEVAAQGLRVEAPRIDVDGDVVDLRDARIRTRSSAPGLLELRTVDAECDLTGARLRNVELVHQCASLAGP